MKSVSFSSLNKIEQNLIKEAFEASEHSISDHKVGCAILDTEGGIHKGSVNRHSRVVGPTCAERMAVDQLSFKDKIPELCVLVGTFKRKGWKDHFLCTPCGVCLEMFLDLKKRLGIEEVRFLCVSWDKTKVLRVDLGELYPQIGKN